jgi:hypothetical protein
MGSNIKCVAAMCSRCGFTTRAMAGADVTAAYPDRAAWAKLCWNRPGTKNPLACPDLVKAVVAGGKDLSRRLKIADTLRLPDRLAG